MVPDPAKTCLALEYFCSQDDDLWRSNDADLERLAARELERLGLARRADVVEATVARVPQAYPVYDVDYRSHLDTVLGFLSGFANLRLIGRNGTHSYVNQDRAMHSAMLAVDGLLGAAPESGRAAAEDARCDEGPVPRHYRI
jgi:protoporphyrinogen oxidase